MRSKAYKKLLLPLGVLLCALLTGSLCIPAYHVDDIALTGTDLSGNRSLAIINFNGEGDEVFAEGEQIGTLAKVVKIEKRSVTLKTLHNERLRTLYLDGKVKDTAINIAQKGEDVFSTAIQSATLQKVSADVIKIRYPQNRAPGNLPKTIYINREGTSFSADPAR